MCDNLDRCTFSRHWDVSKGHLCPDWNIEAFLMRLKYLERSWLLDLCDFRSPWAPAFPTNMSLFREGIYCSTNRPCALSSAGSVWTKPSMVARDIMKENTLLVPFESSYAIAIEWHSGRAFFLLPKSTCACKYSGDMKRFLPEYNVGWVDFLFWGK